MAMVLRSLYIEPLTDSALASRAEQEGITKAELMRRFLLDGLRRPASMFAEYATDTEKERASNTLWPIDPAGNADQSSVIVFDEKPGKKTSGTPKRAEDRRKKKPQRVERRAVGSTRR